MDICILTYSQPVTVLRQVKLIALRSGTDGSDELLHPRPGSWAARHLGQ